MQLSAGKLKFVHAWPMQRARLPWAVPRMPQRAATTTTVSRSLGGKTPSHEVRAGAKPKRRDLGPGSRAAVRVEDSWVCCDHLNRLGNLEPWR